LKIYKDKEAHLRYLKGKTIAIIGYGSQGKAQALNLKDSGLNVIIGLPKKSKSLMIAKKDGFKVFTTEKATQLGDIFSILAPDHLHQEIFESQIKKNLGPNQALIFAHATTIYFKLIQPPKYVDVILVAPHGPGELLRKGGACPLRFSEAYKGLPYKIPPTRMTAFLAIHQDYSGNAKKIGLAYAKGVGLTKDGIIQTTFKDEAIGDLFGEQAVLCGGLSELIKSGFETLVEDGLSPENAYLECVHQIDLIVNLIKSYGIAGMYNRISQLAEYGSYLSGKRVINKAQMKKILDQIKNGTFIKNWIKEYKGGMRNYKKMKKAYQKHLLEKTAAKMRKVVRVFN
jgi:ketol-acid reductoisomerase